MKKNFYWVQIKICLLFSLLVPFHALLMKILLSISSSYSNILTDFFVAALIIFYITIQVTVLLFILLNSDEIIQKLFSIGIRYSWIKWFYVVSCILIAFIMFPVGIYFYESYIQKRFPKNTLDSHSYENRDRMLLILLLWTVGIILFSSFNFDNYHTTSDIGIYSSVLTGIYLFLTWKEKTIIEKATISSFMFLLSTLIFPTLLVCFLDLLKYIKRKRASIT